MKRAFEIQFTWIFVLVAGAVLFLFFMGIVAKQKALAEDKNAIAVKAKLSSIFSLSLAMSDAFNGYPIPDVEMHFSCGDPADASFSVGARGSADALSSVVFAQKSMQGNKLLVWTKEWLLPYKAGTFVYLSSPRTRYIFYRAAGSEEFMDWLLMEFPDGVNQVVMHSKDPAVLKTAGFDSQVIVQEDAPGKITVAELEAMGGFSSSREKVRLVSIAPEANRNFGKITFETLHATGSDSVSPSGKFGYYYRKELLYGAVFAPEYDYYRCMMQKALIIGSTVTMMNARRVAELDANASGTTVNSLGLINPRCANLYYYIKNTFENDTYPYCGNVRVFDDVMSLVKQEMDPLSQAMNPVTDCVGPCAKPCVAGNDFQRLEDNYLRLEREEEDISLAGGCPYVY